MARVICSISLVHKKSVTQGRKRVPSEQQIVKTFFLRDTQTQTVDAISSPKRLSILQNNTSKGSPKKVCNMENGLFLPHEYLEKETILKMEKEVEDLWRNRKENINQQGILRNCTGGWCHTSKVTCKVSKASTTNVHDVE